MPERVLVISPEAVFPTNAGGRAAVLAQCAALRRAGFTVDLLVFHRHSVTPTERREHTSVARRTVFVRRRPLAAASIAAPAQPYQMSSRWLSAANVRSVERALERPSLIVAQQEWTLLAADRLWREDPPPVLLSSHNDELAYFRDQFSAAHGVRRLYLGVERLRLAAALRRALRVPSGVVTLSAQDEQGYPGLPVRTIPHPLPERGAARSAPARRSDVIFVGALDMPHAVQGLLWFVRTVWPTILQAVPTTRFVVAGRRAPAALRIELEAAPGVEFLGATPDLEPVYERAAVFVNPVFLGSGINIKLAEPLGLAIPSVTTSVGSRGYEQLGDALAVADAPEDFADRCLALLTDPERARRTSDLISERAEMLRMPEVVRRWRDVVTARL